MKRDMELVRRILLHVQEKQGLRPEPVSFADVDNDTVGRHVEMLFDEAMLDGSAVNLTTLSYKRVLVSDLTWSGHDFVAALQNDSVWEKMKQRLTAVELASVPLGLLKSLASGLLEQYLKGKLGL